MAYKLPDLYRMNDDALFNAMPQDFITPGVELGGEQQAKPRPDVKNPALFKAFVGMVQDNYKTKYGKAITEDEAEEMLFSKRVAIPQAVPTLTAIAQNQSARLKQKEYNILDRQQKEIEAQGAHQRALDLTAEQRAQEVHEDALVQSAFDRRAILEKALGFATLDTFNWETLGVADPGSYLDEQGNVREGYHRAYDSNKESIKAQLQQLFPTYNPTASVVERLALGQDLKGLGLTTLGGREMTTVEAATEWQEARDRAALTGNLYDEQTGMTVATLDRLTLQLQRAEITGVFEDGTETLAAKADRLDRLAQNRLWFGFDEERQVYDEDGNAVYRADGQPVKELVHIYGTNELEYLRHSETLEWEKMLAEGYAYTDADGNRAVLRGRDQVWEDEEALKKALVSGWDETVYEADGTTPKTDTDGNIVIKRVYGSSELESQALALQAQGMDSQEAYNFALLDDKRREREGGYRVRGLQILDLDIAEADQGILMGLNLPDEVYVDASLDGDDRQINFRRFTEWAKNGDNATIAANLLSSQKANLIGQVQSILGHAPTSTEIASLLRGEHVAALGEDGSPIVEWMMGTADQAAESLRLQQEGLLSDEQIAAANRELQAMLQFGGMREDRDGKQTWVHGTLDHQSDMAEIARKNNIDLAQLEFHLDVLRREGGDHTVEYKDNMGETVTKVIKVEGTDTTQQNLLRLQSTLGLEAQELEFVLEQKAIYGSTDPLSFNRTNADGTVSQYSLPAISGSKQMLEDLENLRSHLRLDEAEFNTFMEAALREGVDEDGEVTFTLADKTTRTVALPEMDGSNAHAKSLIALQGQWGITTQQMEAVLTAMQREGSETGLSVEYQDLDGKTQTLAISTIDGSRETLREQLEFERQKVWGYYAYDENGDFITEIDEDGNEVKVWNAGSQEHESELDELAREMQYDGWRFQDAREALQYARTFAVEDAALVTADYERAMRWYYTNTLKMDESDAEIAAAAAADNMRNKFGTTLEETLQQMRLDAEEARYDVESNNAMWSAVISSIGPSLGALTTDGLKGLWDLAFGNDDDSSGPVTVEQLVALGLGKETAELIAPRLQGVERPGGSNVPRFDIVDGKGKVLFTGTSQEVASKLGQYGTAARVRESMPGPTQMYSVTGVDGDARYFDDPSNAVAYQEQLTLAGTKSEVSVLNVSDTMPDGTTGNSWTVFDSQGNPITVIDRDGNQMNIGSFGTREEALEYWQQNPGDVGSIANTQSEYVVTLEDGSQRMFDTMDEADHYRYDWSPYSTQASITAVDPKNQFKIDDDTNRNTVDDLIDSGGGEAPWLTRRFGLDADKPLGMADYIQGLLEFSAGFAQQQQDVTAGQAVMRDMAVIGGNMLSPTNFAFTTALYLGGNMVGSIYDTWSGNAQDRRDARDQQLYTELRMRDERSDWFSGIEDDILSTDNGMFEKPEDLDGVSIRINWDRTFDPNTARPGEVPNTRVQYYDKRLADSHPDFLLYEESIGDFTKRTGYVPNPFLGREDEVYNDLGPSLQAKLTEFKPSFGMMHPDGSWTFTNRASTRTVDVSREEIAALEDEFRALRPQR